MKKSDCKEALEIYKRFLTRVTKIGEFMKLAEVRDLKQFNFMAFMINLSAARYFAISSRIPWEFKDCEVSLS